MVDWIFLEGQAQDFIQSMLKWDVEPMTAKDKWIKEFCRERNIKDVKNFTVAFWSIVK